MAIPNIVSKRGPLEWQGSLHNCGQRGQDRRTRGPPTESFSAANRVPALFAKVTSNYGAPKPEELPGEPGKVRSPYLGDGTAKQLDSAGFVNQSLGRSAKPVVSYVFTGNSS
jgi:hypothetical protein